MAEAGTEETVVATETAETQAEDQTQESEVSQTQDLDDDKEPGGTDGAAVYARRKNREAKAAKEAFEAEREARIRLEEQLSAAKQQQERTPQKKVFTPEQVWAEVAAGRLDADKANEYLENTKQTLRDQVRAALREEIAATRPIETAIEKINQYRSEIDWANDKTHPNFLKAQVKFRELVARGSPMNEATELTALEFVAGDLDTLRKRNAMREQTRAGARPAPVDVGAGGNGTQRSTDVTSKVPKDLVEGWRRLGANDEQVKKYAQHHLDRMSRRRTAMGG